MGVETTGAGQFVPAVPVGTSFGTGGTTGGPAPAAPTTLDDARRDLWAMLDDGATCPLCLQHAQRYRRVFTALMAFALVQLYRLWYVRHDWVHVSELPKIVHQSGGSFALVDKWGLAEQRPRGDGDHGRTSGWWRPTSAGRAFVRGAATIQRTAVIYANRVERFDGAQIKIGDALGTRFDWNKLMEGFKETA